MKKLFEKIFGSAPEVGNDVEGYYATDAESSLNEDGSSKMLLIEPRAFSEAAEIVTYLKKRVTVVVNLKRVTGEQAKRIIDYLSGAVFAIEGNIEKVGGGIFLCAPRNVNVEGRITEDSEGKSVEKAESEW